jgi:hypothetical protein
MGAVLRSRLRKNRVLCHARAVLLWSVACFIGAQLATVVVLEWKQPEFYDAKYGYRLRSLRQRLSRDRGAPLLLILGTSRAEQGFRPSLLRVPPEPNAPVVFNLARGGNSPLLNLITLQRLLADGIRPDWVLLEIFPPSLVREKTGVTIAKTTLRDFPALQRHSTSWKTYVYAVRDRVLLWSKYRSGILACWGPGWLSAKLFRPDSLWDAQSGEWLAINDGVTPQESRDLTADAQHRYFRRLQDFCVGSDTDRALRELLDQCRQQRIGVVLFVMPEASEFRRWYPPSALARLSGYLAALQREYGVPLVDARSWLPDDCFYDGHHLLQQGAARFTRRFGIEVLPGLLSRAKNRRYTNALAKDATRF